MIDDAIIARFDHRVGSFRLDNRKTENPRNFRIRGIDCGENSSMHWPKPFGDDGVIVAVVVSRKGNLVLIYVVITDSLPPGTISFIRKDYETRLTWRHETYNLSRMETKFSHVV